MSLIKSIDELPDVSFIGDITLDDVRAQMIADYRAKYEELTGTASELPADDKNRLLLGVCAMQIYQGFRFIEQTGKMNLLKYASGAFLDNLGALKNVKRNENAKSTVTIRFTKDNSVLQNEIVIPAKTRVTTEDYEVFWETPDIEVTIPAGRLYIDVDCTCTEDGSFSNGFEYGEIAVLADTVAFIRSVGNVNTSSGGADYENDDAFRLRILNAPSGYSTAGAADSYCYFIKQLDPQIADVAVEPGENDGELTAYILTYSGVLTADQITAIQALVDNADFRPLTDKVTVAAATSITYGVDLLYYVSKKNESKLTSIRMAVEKAVDEFIAAQSVSLGKNVNPSVLIQKVMNAGACRVHLNSPSFAQVNSHQYAMETYRITQYMGLE